MLSLFLNKIFFFFHVFLSGSPTDGNGGDDGSKDKDSMNKKNDKTQLCCPKCGNPCTHVELFVCK